MDIVLLLLSLMLLWLQLQKHLPTKRKKKGHKSKYMLTIPTMAFL